MFTCNWVENSLDTGDAKKLYLVPCEERKDASKCPDNLVCKKHSCIDKDGKESLTQILILFKFLITYF